MQVILGDDATQDNNGSPKNGEQEQSDGQQPNSEAPNGEPPAFDPLMMLNPLNLVSQIEQQLIIRHFPIF